MSLFGDDNSAFELLGRTRERILASKPVIPPPGTLARPGRNPVEAGARTVPRFSGGPVASAMVERAVADLLDVDGDPLLVIDDELDVETITEEDGIVEDATPSRVLGVRADTAVVFGLGLCLVVGIAYLAGRTAKPTGDAAKAVQTAAAKPLAPPAQAAPAAGAPVSLDTPADDESPARSGSPATATTAPASGSSPESLKASANASGNASVPAGFTKPVEGAWEIWVCTTSDDRAAGVVKFLNEKILSSGSDTARFQAYASKARKGSQVRIRGFEKQDSELLELVRRIPGAGGGPFPEAAFHKTKR